MNHSTDQRHGAEDSAYGSSGKLEQLESLLDHLPGMVYRCRNDRDWTMEVIRGACGELTGYAPDDLIGNARCSYASLIVAEDRDKVWRAVQDALASGGVFQLSYRIVTASGSERYIWEQGRCVFDEVGNLVGLQGYIADVTQTQHAKGDAY